MKWIRNLLIAALYVSVFGCATPPTATAPAPETEAAPPLESLAESAPAIAPTLEGTEPASAAAAAPVMALEGTEPHIALLLPIKSSVFARAATAVQNGFLAAAQVSHSKLPVLVYPCVDEASEIATLYRQAVLAGAVAVAGPLTRNGVTALAASDDLTVPTLALNMLDEPRDDQLYFFGLPAEAEARQVANRASNLGLYAASIIRTNSPFSKRLAQTFAEEWVQLGGYVLTEIVYDGDPSLIRELQPQFGGAVFIAAEVERARRLRPFVDPMLPVYSTSQVFNGNTDAMVNYDLSDVRFVDMPWLLQPDHPAVMIYPHSEPPLPADQERLYALGIDAWRLLQVMSNHQTGRALPLDGVTGRITLTGHQFQREALPAIMRAGQGIPLASAIRP